MNRFLLFCCFALAGISAIGQTRRIGVNTTAPQSDLDIQGDTVGMRNSFGTWDNLWFFINDTIASINASGAEKGMRFRVGANSSGVYGNGQAFNTVMTLMPDGRLGLGTSAPFSQFSNTTKNTIASDGGGGNPFSFAWSANQPGYAAQIFNEGNLSSSNGLVVKVLNGSAKILDLSLGQQESLATPVMNVWADGRIGINTAIPALPFDMSGGTSKSGMRVTTGRGQSDCDGLLILKDSSNNTASNGNNEIIAFVNTGNFLIGTVTHVANANSIAFNTTSDIRLKTDIRSTRYGLKDLMAIEVSDYKYKGIANASPQTGFLAQQLYTIFPEAVTKGDDVDEKHPYMIDYGRLSPLLVKSVQELKTQVDALQKQVQTLQQEKQVLQTNNQRISDLATQVMKLQQTMNANKQTAAIVK